MALLGCFLLSALCWPLGLFTINTALISGPTRMFFTVSTVLTSGPWFVAQTQRRWAQGDSCRCGASRRRRRQQEPRRRPPWRRRGCTWMTWPHWRTQRSPNSTWAVHGKEDDTLVGWVGRLPHHRAASHYLLVVVYYAWGHGSMLLCSWSYHYVVPQRILFLHFRSCVCMWASNAPATGCTCAFFISVVLIVP